MNYKSFCINLILFFCFYINIILGQDNNHNESKNSLAIKNYFDKGFKQINSSPDSSIYFTKIALDLANSSNNYEYIAKCENLLGCAYIYKDVHYKAIEHFLNALKMFEKLNNLNGIAMTYTNLGNINRMLSNHDKALDYYLRAANLYNKLSDKSDKNSLASCLVNIGIIYNDKENFYKAIKYYKKAVSLYQSSGYQNGLAYCYNSMGIAYTGIKSLDKSKKYAKANYYFNKSLEIFEEANDKIGMVTSLINLSDLHITLGNYKQSIYFSEKALDIINETGGLLSKSITYNNLSIAYDSLHNSQKALVYYKLFKQTNDSIYNLEKNKQINEIQFKYEKSKKERELDEKKSMIIVLEQIKRADNLKKNILIGGILSAIIISLFFINGIKRRMILNKKLFENKKLLVEKELENEKLKSQQLHKELELKELDIKYKNQEIDYKNQELIDFALNISNKNELLEEIKNSIKNHKDKEEASTIKHIISFNQNSLKNERKELINRIELINQSFYLKLREIIPDITNSEETLCALIRLKLTTKEIALALNISTQSVNIYRYRLRKKVNLNKNISFYDYINSL